LSYSSNLSATPQIHPLSLHDALPISAEGRCGVIELARAAERLLRSGAFGLVVLDLAGADLNMAIQGRLVTLAQSHDAAVVCLTRSEEHTSELQSRSDLVCRLLLEKKK